MLRLAFSLIEILESTPVHICIARAYRTVVPLPGLRSTGLDDVVGRGSTYLAPCVLSANRISNASRE